MPQVSVCIPNYNYADYLGTCIDSVLRQEVDDLELLIVDDASTDDSDVVLRRYHDPRLRVIRQPRRVGLVRNWNACLQAASADLVLVLHADDFLLPGALERQRRCMEQNPGVGFVFGSAQLIDRAGAVIEVLRPKPQDKLMKHPAGFSELVQENVVRAPTVMVRRACYTRLGGFNQELAFTADWEMWLRIALYYDVAFLAQPLAAYRLHDRNATNEFYLNLKDLEEEQRTIEMLFAHLPPGLEELQASRPAALQGIASRAVWRIEHLLRMGQTENILEYARLAWRLQSGRTDAPEPSGAELSQFILEKAAGTAHVLYEENARLREWGHDLEAALLRVDRKSALARALSPAALARRLRPVPRR